MRMRHRGAHLDRMATRRKTVHAKRGQAPWMRDAPLSAEHRKLTPELKAVAKARAKRAGRPYPNLVDNMSVAKTPPRVTQRESASARRKRAS
jgi:hypothetical protein